MSPDLPDYSRSRAILIGASDYRDKGFLPLPAVANSLKGMQEILVDSQLCSWPADKVTVLANPTDCRRLIPELRHWARSTDDVLLVYFVGHGTIAPRGELCLALSDTELDEPDVTGIEYERVRSALLDSPARIKVVILDCCYSGRAIQALSGPADLADITDIRGVYTITASDHAAHVPPLDQQAGACTSFTGELLDLIRTGIPGAPDTLTLNTIYSHLRTRLRRCQLPAPNQRGTDTVGEFGFTRNAALLPHPIERFPRLETPPASRPGWRRRILAVAAAGALAVTAVFITDETRSPGVGVPPLTCTTGPAAPGRVVIGSANNGESDFLDEVYAQALEAAGISTTIECGYNSRSVYYNAMTSGELAIVPEYNGALLTKLDPHTRAISTHDVDAALHAKLPRSLGILDPAPAQNQDTVTVTSQTAKKYHLRSLTDLIRVSKALKIGAPPEFQHREQGLAGLWRKYGIRFKEFKALDFSGSETVSYLKHNDVQAADIFSSYPWFRADHFVRLADPKHVFIADNIVPLIRKPKVRRAAARILNNISGKLTQDSLEKEDTLIMEDGESPATAAKSWLQKAGLG